MFHWSRRRQLSAGVLMCMVEMACLPRTYVWHLEVGMHWGMTDESPLTSCGTPELMQVWLPKCEVQFSNIPNAWHAFLGSLGFRRRVDDARFTVRSDDYMTSLLARILSSTTSETSSPKSIGRLDDWHSFIGPQPNIILSKSTSI
jgi:hypothetical protein